MKGCCTDLKLDIALGKLAIYGGKLSANDEAAENFH